MKRKAVEKASYISWSVLESEYDGQTYHLKYHEDLVHSEITLPENASKAYALWNSVEMVEKGQKAQLARMLKASLPNEWKSEIHSLQAEYDSINKEQSKITTELAYAEVIGYNRKNLERELQNESRQQNKTKRRDKEI